MHIGIGLQTGGTPRGQFGPNLLTNTDGTSVVGWNDFNCVNSSIGGEFRVTSTATTAFPQSYRAVTGLEIGAVYQASATARRGTTADPAFITAASGVNVTTSSLTNVTISLEWTADATSTNFGMGVFTGSADGGNVFFDDVAFRRKYY